MDAPVEYVKDFVSNPDEVFDSLWNELDWARVSNRRIEYWFNSLNMPYTYGKDLSARTYQPQRSHSAIEYVTTLLEIKYGFRYEGCFLNGYENARDGLEWHSDDDVHIDHDFPIAVVTVGGGRAIQFVEIPVPGEKIDKSKVQEVFLEPGSLLMMKPGMQSTHRHRIPKAGYVISKPRISLTFRKLVA